MEMVHDQQHDNKWLVPTYSCLLSNI